MPFCFFGHLSASSLPTSRRHNNTVNSCASPTAHARSNYNEFIAALPPA